MLDAEKIELVRRFVQRYCSADSKGNVREGYFAFVAGPRIRGAVKAREQIPFGLPGETSAAVIERAEDVLSAREGHLWIRAYHVGESHHAGQIRLDGVIEEQDPTDLQTFDDGNLAGAVVRTNSMLANMVTDAYRTIERFQNERVGTGIQLTHLALQQGLGDIAMRQEAMRAAVEQLGPLVQTLGPLVIEAMLGRGGGGSTAEPGPPTGSPAEQIRVFVGRLHAAAGGIVAVVRGTEGGVDAEAVAELQRVKALIVQLAPLFGLTVAEGAAAEGAA